MTAPAQRKMATVSGHADIVCLRSHLAAGILMAQMDKYNNFNDLATAEDREHYHIEVTDRSSDLLIIAPHGGKIEAGTAEIARAVAGDTWSFYAFEGRRPNRNRDLHITSSNFDEPRALAIAAKANIILGIHGCIDRDDPLTILVGGRDAARAESLVRTLNSQGYAAKIDTERFPALDPRNICNRGKSQMGVQLEIPASVRTRVMGDSGDFDGLVAAIRFALSTYR